MKEYIQIKDGITINHPAQEENLLQAFGEIPKDWALFQRTAVPSFILPAYKVYYTEYVVDVDGKTWKDNWKIRDFTEEEKQYQITSTKSFCPYKAWVFDEPSCSWLPPFPKPTSDKPWVWDEETLDWKDMTPPEMQLSAVSFI